MNIPNVFVKNGRLLSRIVTQNSPAIFTGIGVVGIVGTAVVTHKATTKANQIIANEQYKRNINAQFGEETDLTKNEKVRLVWKTYAPVVVVVSLSVAAVVGAQYVNTKRMAALMAGYVALESKHEEYKDKVLEMVGKKKSDAIDESVYKDMVARNTVGGIEVMAGDVPCIDALTGKPFSSNMESIRKACNDINERIVHGDQPSVSDLYAILGIPLNRLSDAFGWNDENMCELKPSTILDDAGVPYLIMDFSVLPVGNFWKIGK